jgi:CHRD domain
MKKLIMLAVVVLVTVGAPLGLAAGSERTPGFVASLAGKNEVPPVNGRLTGTATFHPVDNNQVLAFRLSLENASQVLMAHIHLGKQGANGEVVAFLLGSLPAPGLTQSHVNVEGFLTNANLIGPLKGKTIADLVTAMKAGDTYVNAHTVAHPAGAARGQIRVRP